MLIAKMEGRILILFAVCLFVAFGGSNGIYLENSCENGPYDGDDACTLGSEVIPRAHRVSLLTRAWTYDANKPGVDRCVRVDACHYNIRPGNNLYYTLAECRAACVARV